MSDSSSKKKNGTINESPITYEDYVNMPDDGCRYELANGKLELMSPAPRPNHQGFSFELHKRLASDCGQEYLILCAPIDVILSEKEVRQPDLVMIHRTRQSIIRKRGIFGAPDLVVEILSEHSRKRDKVHKTRVYAEYGIPEYWIADLTNGTLEQYELAGDRYELVDVSAEDEPVQSGRLACVTFTMNDLMKDLPELED